MPILELAFREDGKIEFTQNTDRHGGFIPDEAQNRL
jgi:hypothetical protein